MNWKDTLRRKWELGLMPYTRTFSMWLVCASIAGVACGAGRGASSRAGGALSLCRPEGAEGDDVPASGLPFLPSCSAVRPPSRGSEDRAMPARDSSIGASSREKS